MSFGLLSKKPKKIGLALGGGGAKGLAHIGVIKTLERAGIAIDFIAGTSMGAIVGAWYALTRDINALAEIFSKIKTRDIFPVKEILGRKDGALFQGASVSRLLEKYFKAAKIEDCKIPFRAVATDVKNGDEVVIRSGKLIDAVMASSALPIVFRPVEIEKKILIDGGFVNPVPADVAKKLGGEYVLAVDVSSRWPNVPEKLAGAASIYSMFSSSLSIVEYQLAKKILADNADYVLRPPVLNFGWLDFNKTEDVMQVGEEEAALHLKEIRSGSLYPEPQKTIGEKFMDFLFHADEG